MKGYIFEMAMRLEDDDDRISGLAKLFFHELSKKGGARHLAFDICRFCGCFCNDPLHFSAGNNPIYNLLPDILGRLSNQNLQEEIFCNIMQFLIGSIKKVMHFGLFLSCRLKQNFFFMLLNNIGQTNGSTC